MRRLALILPIALLLSPLAQAADIVRVGVPSQGFVFSPLAVGQQAGIFSRAGLDVQKILFSGAAKLTQAMMVGAADIALSGATDAAYAVKGAPETTVCAIAIRALNLSVIARPEIHAIADLKGARIGVTSSGTITYWLAQELARKQQWGPQGIIPVQVGGLVAAQTAALVTNQVAALIGDTSLGLQLQAEGRGHILVTADSYVPNFLTITMLAHNDLIANHPDTLRRFVAAWLETITYLLDHKAEAVQAAAVATELPAPIISASYDIQRPQWSRDGRISPAQLDQLSTALVDIGLLDSKPNLTPYVTDRFLPDPLSR